ncbi:MAG: hypothetical protein IJJ33_03150 [Victivallales bacterium]|nr:hypothetical protein [Victivallales bacterium]
MDVKTEKGKRVLAACILAGVVCLAGGGEVVAGIPFWEGNTVYGESLLFVREGGDLACATCLFKPDKIIQLKSAFKGIVYVPGKDCLLEPGTRRIVLPQGSRIGFLEAASLFPAVGAEHSINYRKGDRSRGVLFHRLTGFCEMQTEVVYEHTEKWPGSVPGFVGDKLPLFQGKIDICQAILSNIYELFSSHYVSLTGNGVNHPNDFGHRVYAQYLLSMFVKREKE